MFNYRMLTAICAAVALLGAAVYAQSGAERIYLPDLSATAPSPTAEPTPAPTLTPEPTAAPMLPAWRRPGSPYIALSVVDVQALDSATLRVTVRNDAGRTVSSVVLSRVVYDAGGAYVGERAERYSAGVRILPGELRELLMFGYTAPTPPTSRIEAFAIPE